MALTSEDFVHEGWLPKGKSVDIWFEKEGHFERTSWTAYKAVLHYNLTDHWLFIHLLDTGDEVPIFQGVCENLDDLHEIFRLTRLT